MGKLWEYRPSERIVVKGFDELSRVLKNCWLSSFDRLKSENQITEPRPFEDGQVQDLTFGAILVDVVF